MSKRKPALRIGGGVLNRNTTSCDSKVARTDQRRIVEDATNDELESQLANFMKEIDEVSSVPLDPHKQQERYGDWQKCLDENTHHSYYWNVVTDEVSWVLPDEFSRAEKTPASDSLQQDPESVPKKYEKDELKDICNTQTSVQQLPSEESRHNPEIITQAATETFSITATKGTSKHESAFDEHDFQKVPTSNTKNQIDQSILTESYRNENHSPRIPSKDEQISSTIEIGTQCKLSPSVCLPGDDASSSKIEVLQLRDTLIGKMNYLGVSNASLMHLQILLIQIETRISDWKARVLPTSYVLERLKEAQSSLTSFEDSATPAGWTCHWDSTASRYYYVNKSNHHKQWSYPGMKMVTKTSEDSESEEDTDKTNSDDLSGKDLPNPPLPDMPVEKPPPPPPQPEDEGFDVGEDEDNPKKCDDGIMMEISEDEKDEITEQDTKEPLVSVVSQQPIIYKGYEVSSHSEHIVKNHPQIYEHQSYSFTHNKMMPVKLKAKKAKTGKKAGKPYKAMTSLVAQWQRAKEEIDEEDRMLEESDEEEKEDPTHLKIAKWKHDQIISGKAVSNPNFEPVPTDWRTRLLEKKKKL